MSRIVAFANQKGGVGKSTSALNVAAAVVERGQRALLIDLDPQGSLTIAAGVDRAALSRSIYDALIRPDVPLESVILPAKPGIDLAPAVRDLSGAKVELVGMLNRERALARKLTPIRDRYDFIAIDCEPDLGLLTINALTAADQVLIPCECQFLALQGMQELLKTIQDVQAYTNPGLQVIGILPTKYDSRTLHNREALEEMRTSYDGLVMDPPIRFRIGLADAAISGKTIFEFDRRSDSAAEYRHVAEVILNG